MRMGHERADLPVAHWEACSAPHHRAVSDVDGMPPRATVETRLGYRK